MYHLVIYRCANRSWKRIAILIRKTFKGWNSTIVSDELFRHPIQLFCCHSGLYNLSYLSQRLSNKQITLTEQLYFIFCFKKYHSSKKINMQLHYHCGL